jgi:hypothetical protein
MTSRNGAPSRKEYEEWEKRAHGECRQERPHPHRRSDADPLEDVEDEVHRAVP